MGVPAAWVGTVRGFRQFIQVCLSLSHSSPNPKIFWKHIVADTHQAFFVICQLCVLTMLRESCMGSLEMPLLGEVWVSPLPHKVGGDGWCSQFELAVPQHPHKT